MVKKKQKKEKIKPWCYVCGDDIKENEVVKEELIFCSKQCQHFFHKGTKKHVVNKI